MRTRSTAALFAAAVSLAACDGARQAWSMLSAVREVQHQVVLAVHEDNVNVNLNNGQYLTVSLVNSSLKELPEAQKKAKAREIALVAYKAFPSRSTLERVSVVFVLHRTSYLVFSYTDGTDYHAFSAQELARDAAGT